MLYELQEDDTLKKTNIESLAKALQDQKSTALEDVDDLFDASSYLVSPFNSTEKFMTGEYFLTKQQEEFKVKITKSIHSSKTGLFIALSGNAGTGKTLLTYDIVKTFLQAKKKVLAINCGQLNDGHNKLNQNSGWEIIAIKDINYSSLKSYDLIVIDEAQRLYEKQFVKIKDHDIMQEQCVQING